MRRAVRLLLTRLCCLATLCLLSVGRSRAALYEDLAGADNTSVPTATWIATNAAVFDGFCLGSADGDVAVIVNASLRPLQSRVLLNWSQPLYNKTIGLYGVDDTAVAYFWLWIVKLLLQELLGYAVQVHDYALDPYALMLSDPGVVDADPVHYLNPDNPSSYLPSEHVEANLPGVYLPQRTLDAFPQLLLDFWRSYDYAATAPALVNASLAVFINDSWAGLTNQYGQSVLNTSAGELICPPDFVFTQVVGLPPQGCVDGIFVPPRCQASPRTDCAVIYHSNPIYDTVILAGGSISLFVRTLQLPFVIAYINPLVKAQQLAWLNSQGKQFIFWASNLEQAPHTLCNDSSTGLCYGRMSLPSYTASCLAELGNPMLANAHTANYSCDYSIHSLYKMVDPALAVTAPRAYSFFDSFIMTPADTAAMYELLSLQVAADPAQAEEPDYKRLACSWIGNNTDRWLPWIPPPALCGINDLLFHQSDCQPSTATLTVSYSWNEPKACQLGIALPEPDVIRCDSVTLALPSAAAATALSGIVVCLSLLVAALAGTAPFCRRRAVRQMTAAIQLQAAADKAQSQQARTKPTLRLSRWQRLSGFVASLLLSGLLSPSMAVLMMLGSCLLLAVNWVNLGSVSETQCQSRLALLLAGLAAWHAALFAAGIRLHFTCRQQRILSLQEQLGRRLALAAGCIWAVQVVLLVAQAASGPSLAAQSVITLPGGGQVLASYCGMPTPWLEVVIVTINLMLAGATLLITLRSLLLLQRQWASGEKDRQSGVRKHLQAVTVLSCQLLTLAAGFTLVLTFAGSDTAAEPENAARVQLQQVTTLVCSAAMLLCLLGPSLAFVWWRRRAAAHKTAAAAPRRDGSVTHHGSVNSDSGGVFKTSGRSDTLAGTLGDPLCCALFTQYCEDVHDAEPIHFLLAAQDFFRLLHQPQTSLQQLQGGLLLPSWTSFLLPDSAQQVNISAQQRMQVERALADIALKAAVYTQAAAGAGKLGAAVGCSEECRSLARAAFEPVVKEVFAVLEVNGFARFLHSSAAVRAYDLVCWSEEFSAMTQREQKGALDRLSRLSSQPTAAPALKSPEMLSRNSAVSSRISLDARPHKSRTSQQTLAGPKRSSEQQVAPEPPQTTLPQSQTQTWFK